MISMGQFSPLPLALGDLRRAALSDAVMKGPSQLIPRANFIDSSGAPRLVDLTVARSGRGVRVSKRRVLKCVSPMRLLRVFLMIVSEISVCLDWSLPRS